MSLYSFFLYESNDIKYGFFGQKLKKLWLSEFFGKLFENLNIKVLDFFFNLIKGI